MKIAAERPCVSCCGPLCESQRTRWSGRIADWVLVKFELLKMNLVQA